MMCFLAQNNIVSGIFASNLLRLKNHQLFRELLEVKQPKTEGGDNRMQHEQGKVK